MKKFSFSLQTVLDYKNQYLDGLKNEYAIAAAEVEKQTKYIEKIKCIYKEVNNQYNEKKYTFLAIYEMETYDKYLKKLEQDIEKENIILFELKEIAEQKLNIMIESKIDVASLEKLKEKKLQEYNYYVNKQEEIFIEEFVMNKSTIKN